MKLNFREFGSGQPLIILHGLLGMSDNWVTLGRRLGETMHVLIPDLRNHGASPHSDEFSLRIMTSDISEFISTRFDGPVRIMGHSLGGRIAVNIAVSEPHLIQSMVAVDIAPRMYPPNTYLLNMLKQMRSVNLRQMSSLAEIENVLAEKFPDARIRNFILKNVGKVGTAYTWKPNVDSIINGFNELMAPLSSNALYRGPALFVRGGLSEFIAPDDFAIIEKIFPSSRIVTIQRAGHWVQADAPKQLFGLVSAFFRHQ